MSRRETFLRELLKKTILQNRWIPLKHRKKITPKQVEFLLLTCKEAFYGGAAGGGKSEALLMGALQFVNIKGYNALLLRRRFSDLILPEALMSRAEEWLGGTDARWKSKDHIWVFPSGAKLAFGYLEHEKDKYRYQSAAFQFIGFDELTQFTESQYRYLFSRLRRLEGVNIPLRMRSASNPGGIGHEWVKQRFIVAGREKGRIFIPARLDDNPNIDRAQYIESLKELDPTTRARLLKGDWEIRDEGGLFHRSWFTIVDSYPKDARKIRYWDLAATQPKKGSDPDYTVGALVAEKDGIFYVVDIKRVRRTPQQVEALVKQTAQLDKKDVQIFMETEPGSAGKSLIDHYARHILVGYTFRGHKTTGSKEIRAQPVSSAAEAGNVKLVSASWNGDFLDEVELFPYGRYDDQVDAVSGAFLQLAGKKRVRYRGRVF